MAKQMGLKQMNFLWLFPRLAAEKTDFLLPDGKRKKKRRRKASSAQKWAFELFVRPQLMLEAPGKKYEAIGCSCSFIIKGGSVQPSLCRHHECLEQAFFEAPIEEILKAKQREKEKQEYFSLPMAPLNAETIQHLKKVAIPWSCLDNQGLGQAKNWKGKKFTMEPCGCSFAARKIETPRVEGKYRNGHWWYAVRIDACESIDRDCVFEHLSLNPKLCLGKK